MNSASKEKCSQAHCPFQQVAALLSDAWTMLVIRDLLSGPKRFSDLMSSLEGISTRTLTNKLHHLQEQSLVEKDPAGQYTLTKKGKGLRGIDNAMRRYAKLYMS